MKQFILLFGFILFQISLITCSYFDDYDYDNYNGLDNDYDLQQNNQRPSVQTYQNPNKYNRQSQNRFNRPSQNDQDYNHQINYLDVDDQDSTSYEDNDYDLQQNQRPSVQTYQNPNKFNRQSQNKFNRPSQNDQDYNNPVNYYDVDDQDSTSYEDNDYDFQNRQRPSVQTYQNPNNFYRKSQNNFNRPRQNDQDYNRQVNYLIDDQDSASDEDENLHEDAVNIRRRRSPTPSIVPFVKTADAEARYKRQSQWVISECTRDECRKRGNGWRGLEQCGPAFCTCQNGNAYLQGCGFGLIYHAEKRLCTWHYNVPGC